jgi:hypothetical protein
MAPGASIRVRGIRPCCKAADTWAAAADPEVSWLWQAKVTKLPWVGALLEALGLEVPAVPVKLSHRSYVQFVSEWYNAASSNADAP